MDGEWVESRRTDGIAVMEVPVYDPSDRKRKSHERQCAMSERKRSKEEAREEKERERERAKRKVKEKA